MLSNVLFILLRIISDIRKVFVSAITSRQQIRIAIRINKNVELERKQKENEKRLLTSTCIFPKKDQFNFDRRSAFCK